jgi:hypothetical protein
MFKSNIKESAVKLSELICKNGFTITSRRPDEIWWTLGFGVNSDDELQAWWEPRDFDGSLLEHEARQLNELDIIGVVPTRDEYFEGELNFAAALVELEKSLNAAYVANCMSKKEESAPIIEMNGKRYKLVEV